MTQTDEPKPGEDTTPTEIATPAEPPQAEQPEAAEPQKGKSGPWGTIIVLVLLAAGGAAAVLTWPQWKDQVMPERAEQPVAVTVPAEPQARPEADTDIATLRAELAQTRQRLAQLEDMLSQPAAEGGAPVNLGPLEQRLTQVEQAVKAPPQLPESLVKDLQTLAAQVAELRKNAADASAVLRLADRVDQAEKAVADMRARRTSAAAMLLAVGQLREAVNNALPYDAELRAVRALAPEDAELAQATETLKPHAAAGIPTRLVLAERFQALAPELVRAEVLPEQQSWWRDTLRQMSGLLSVRREDGDAAGDTPAAIVARAEARLASSDLAGAVAEVERLDGMAAETAAPWLNDARARLEANRALGNLTAHVVAAMGPRQ